MKKLLGITAGVVALGFLAAQTQMVSAAPKKNVPAVNPATSPVTSPCKPGWGYGDKNHCHSGPPGLSE